MKKSFVRMLVLAVCIAVMLAMSPVYAQEVSFENGQIQPRWIELNTFQCALERQSGLFSNAKVASTASTSGAYSKIEMTLTIQVWSNGAYIDTSNSWTSSGSGATSIEKNIKLSQGNYRAKSVVKVYSSSGTYLETVTKYSADIVI